MFGNVFRRCFTVLVDGPGISAVYRHTFVLTFTAKGVTAQKRNAVYCQRTTAVLKFPSNKLRSDLCFTVCRQIHTGNRVPQFSLSPTFDMTPKTPPTLDKRPKVRAFLFSKWEAELVLTKLEQFSAGRFIIGTRIHSTILILLPCLFVVSSRFLRLL